MTYNDLAKKTWLKEVLSLISGDIEEYKFFFSSIVKDNINFSIGDSLIDTELIWKSRSLKDYLVHLQSMAGDDIKKSIISFIDSLDEDWKQIKDEKRLKVLLENSNEFYNYLTDQPFSGESKWNLFTFVKDIDKYKRGKYFYSLYNVERAA